MLCVPLVAAAVLQLAVQTVVEVKSTELAACNELESLGATCEYAPLLPAEWSDEVERALPAPLSPFLNWVDGVHLRGGETAAEAVTFLDELPLLHYVWIDRARPAELKAVYALPRLDMVRIDLPSLEEGLAAALRPFCHHRELRQLKLHLEPAALGLQLLSDAEFTALAQSPALECLALRRVRVTPRQLQILGTSSTLTSLVLEHCGLGDAQLRVLAGCEKLMFLGVNDDGLSDESLAGLDTLRSLQTLDVAGARLSDACIPHLAALPWLEFLQISRAPRMTREGGRLLEHLLPNTRIANAEVRGER